MATSNVSRVEDTDALASLESRILRAVQLVTELRSEKQALEEQLRATKSEAQSFTSEMDALKAENTRLLDELEELREERTQVRSRIEKLLGQIDSLAV